MGIRRAEDMFSFVSPSITALVGFSFPAYSTMKVLKSGGDDEYEPTQWLCYWVCFGVLVALDLVLGTIGLAGLVPFWNEVKIILYIWLQVPQFQGALWIYLKFLENVLKPAPA